MEDCSEIVFDKGNTPFNEFMHYNELNYCCTDCSSLIEILYINVIIKIFLKIIIL